MGFDPRRLTLGNDAPIRNTFRPVSRPSSTHAPSSGSSYRLPRHRSLWERIDDGVSSIGEWLTDEGAGILSIGLAAIPGLYYCYKLIAWVVRVWSGDFILGILAAFAALIAAAFIYYACCLLMYVAYALVWVIGLIFYRAWTLLLAIGVGLAIWGAVSIMNHDQLSASKTRTEKVASSTTPYVCTATRLNVRASASKQAIVIGTLQRGQVVQVVRVADGFAEIEFGSRRGYVSIQYLKKK